MKTNINLKVLLLKKQMTQRELAFGTGINEGQISILIRHGIGTSEIKDRVCDFLDVPKNELFKYA